MDTKLLTIFTPTYNRSYILGSLYKSLKDQTIKDFKWLIIDAHTKRKVYHPIIQILYNEIW